MRQLLLYRDRQESGASAGADFGNGLLKHSKDPFPQDSTCLITPAPLEILFIRE